MENMQGLLRSPTLEPISSSLLVPSAIIINRVEHSVEDCQIPSLSSPGPNPPLATQISTPYNTNLVKPNVDITQYLVDGSVQSDLDHGGHAMHSGQHDSQSESMQILSNMQPSTIHKSQGYFAKQPQVMRFGQETHAPENSLRPTQSSALNMHATQITAYTQSQPVYGVEGVHQVDQFNTSSNGQPAMSKAQQHQLGPIHQHSNESGVDRATAKSNFIHIGEQHFGQIHGAHQVGPLNTSFNGLPPAQANLTTHFQYASATLQHRSGQMEQLPNRYDINMSAAPVNVSLHPQYGRQARNVGNRRSMSVGGAQQRYSDQMQNFGNVQNIGMNGIQPVYTDGRQPFANGSCYTMSPIPESFAASSQFYSMSNPTTSLTTLAHGMSIPSSFYTSNTELRNPYGSHNRTEKRRRSSSAYYHRHKHLGPNYLTTLRSQHTSAGIHSSDYNTREKEGLRIQILEAELASYRAAQGQALILASESSSRYVRPAQPDINGYNVPRDDDPNIHTTIPTSHGTDLHGQSFLSNNTSLHFSASNSHLHNSRSQFVPQIPVSITTGPDGPQNQGQAQAFNFDSASQNQHTGSQSQAVDTSNVPQLNTNTSFYPRPTQISNSGSLASFGQGETTPSRVFGRRPGNGATLFSSSPDIHKSGVAKVPFQLAAPIWPKGQVLAQTSPIGRTLSAVRANSRSTQPLSTVLAEFDAAIKRSEHDPRSIEYLSKNNRRHNKRPHTPSPRPRRSRTAALGTLPGGAGLHRIPPSAEVIPAGRAPFGLSGDIPLRRGRSRGHDNSEHKKKRAKMMAASSSAKQLTTNDLTSNTEGKLVANPNTDSAPAKGAVLEGRKQEAIPKKANNRQSTPNKDNKSPNFGSEVISDGGDTPNLETHLRANLRKKAIKNTFDSNPLVTSTMLGVLPADSLFRMGANSQEMPNGFNPPAPVVNRPMKSRLASVTRPQAKKNTMPKSRSRSTIGISHAEARTKVVAKGTQIVEPPKTENEKRQEYSAQLITDIEKNQAEKELFGEELLAEEARQKAVMKQRAVEVAKAKYLAEKEAKKEAAELAERKRKQMLSEEKEAMRIHKEQHNARKIVRREALRKKQLAAEAAQTEERRRATTEKIEIQRAEREERENAKQAASGVQTNLAELARLKENRELLEKQAKCLKLSKAASTTAARPGVFSEGDVRVEDDLFVEKNIPPTEHIEDEEGGVDRQDAACIDGIVLNELNVYDIDAQKTQRVAIGPSTAAQVMARVALRNESTENYRSQREQADAARNSRVHTQTLMRMKSRAEKVERAKSIRVPTIEPRPKQPPKNGIIERPEPAMAKEPPKNVTIETLKPVLVQPTTTGLFPEYIPATRGSASPISFSSTVNIRKKVALPSHPRVTTGASKSSIGVISEENHHQMEAEQAEKDKADKAKKAEEAMERKKAQRKRNDTKAVQKRTDKAREAKRLELIAKAEINGRELSEAELVSQVEEAMRERQAKLDRSNEKRAHNLSIRAKVDNYNTNNDLFETQENLEADLTLDVDFEDKEDDSQQTLERKARMRAAKEDIKATSQNRGGRFSRNLGMTVADEEDSEESEEDPDDGNGDSATLDEFDGNSEAESEQENSNYAAENSNQELRNCSDTGLIVDAELHDSSDIEEPLQEIIDPKDATKVFTVMEKVSNKAGTERPKIVQTYYSRQEANDNFEEFVKTYEKVESVTKVKKWIDLHKLHHARVTFNHDNKNYIEVWVASEFKSTGVVATIVNISSAHHRFREKYYFIHRYLTTKTVDDAGHSTIFKEPETFGPYSDLSYANHTACSMFLDFLKPDPAKIHSSRFIDCVEYHDNELVPLVNATRDTSNKEGAEVALEATPGLSHWEWIREYINIEFNVEERSMEGGLN